MFQIFSAIFGMLLLGTLAGSLFLWTWAFGRFRSGLPLLKFAPRRPVPWGMVDLVVLLVIAMVTIAGGQGLALYGFGLLGKEATDETMARHLSVSIFSGSLSMLAACVVGILYLVIRGASWADLGVQARRLFNDVKIGGAAFAMLAPPMYFIQFVLTRIWPSEHPLQTMLLDDPQLSIILGAVFTAVIVAPLTEEVFFRLMFQGWMEKVSALLEKMKFGAYANGIAGAEQSQSDVVSVLLGDGAARRLGGGVGPFESPDTDGKSLKATEEFVSAADLELTREPDRDELSRESLSNPYLSPGADAEIAEKRIAEPAETLANPLPQTWPIVVSAAIFALLHWGHGPDPIPLFFLAAGLGYVYQRTHRIVPCIVVHFLVNSLSMAALVAFLLSGQEPP